MAVFGRPGGSRLQPGRLDVLVRSREDTLVHLWLADGVPGTLDLGGRVDRFAEPVAVRREPEGNRNATDLVLYRRHEPIPPPEFAPPPDAFRLEPGEPVANPAEQTVLELSSRADANRIDEFEIQEWVPDVAEAGLAAGRHPMLTPPRVVRWVHAVRRPLQAPVAALHAARESSATWATLTDSERPLFGVDRTSTRQVDVAARWHEPVDSDAEGPLLTEQVCSVPVTPDATGLSVRHEFGDTRHRRITHTLKAPSRFRQFYDAGEDTAFQNDTTLAETVSIPSSAPPMAPEVLAVSPSFRWEGSADLAAGPGRGMRRGGRIRGELARPWNLSGADELLAVLTGPGLTRVSRDPIWRTGDAVGPAQPGLFAGAAGATTEHALPGTDTVAQVVSYRPRLHAETDRWCADIELPGATADSYCPFVRLVLAPPAAEPDRVRPVGPCDHRFRADHARPHAVRGARGRGAAGAADRNRATRALPEPGRRPPGGVLGHGGRRRHLRRAGHPGHVASGAATHGVGRARRTAPDAGGPADRRAAAGGSPGSRGH
jgi:hypothetical protein